MGQRRLTNASPIAIQGFDHLNNWWEEFRLYHRKDGKATI